MYFADENTIQIGEHTELSFEVLEIQKTNIPTDRAQRLDKINGAIYLFIMFTPRVMVVKVLIN